MAPGSAAGAARGQAVRGRRLPRPQGHARPGPPEGRSGAGLTWRRQIGPRRPPSAHVRRARSPAPAGPGVKRPRAPSGRDPLPRLRRPPLRAHLTLRALGKASAPPARQASSLPGTLGTPRVAPPGLPDPRPGPSPARPGRRSVPAESRGRGAGRPYSSGWSAAVCPGRRGLRLAGRLRSQSPPQRPAAAAQFTGSGP